MYHPVFREHHSCSLQLKVIATARNRHTAKTWAAHNAMQFLGSHFLHPELETTPLYHADHGKWMRYCPSWWDRGGFRNQTKRWKKYGVPLQSYLLGWHHVTLLMQHTCLLFFSKMRKSSCSSQGPVMQACFRPWTACHDGVHPLWKQTMLSINVNQCAGFYRQQPSSTLLFVPLCSDKLW